MKKTFTGLLMGLLCLHHSALAQVFYNVQNQIPVPEMVDASQAIQTSGNVADYVFQEVSNVVQGVTINLDQDTPPMPYEIHLQSDNTLCQLRFATFFSSPSTPLNGSSPLLSVEVSYDNAAFVTVFSTTAANANPAIPTPWITMPPTFLTPGQHILEVRFTIPGLFSNTIVTEVREYDVRVSPAADGFFVDGTPGNNGMGNTLTRYSNPLCNKTKPMLVVEGYDSGNRTYAEFYRERGDELCQELFALGYDIYVLNFGSNVQSMEINASVVQAAVQYLL